MSSARTDPEKRAQALEAYQAHGLAEAARQTGVAKSTLRDWARQEGLDPAQLAGVAAEVTEAATEARRHYVEALREEARALFMETVIDMLERTRMPHVDFRGKDNDEVLFDHAPAPACRDYVVAAATALDKFRLEMGESTSRSEELRGPLGQQVKRIQRMRDELAPRREKPVPGREAEAV